MKATESSRVHVASPTEDERFNKSPAESQAFKSYLRIFKYGRSREYILHSIGVVSALIAGVGVAMVPLIFGEFVTVMTRFISGEESADAFRDEAAELALYLFVIGVVRFFLTYLYSLVFTLAAYRITRNIRHAYVRAALRQEIAFFDSGSSGSIAMQATSNGRLIQAGTSEKLGLVFQAFSVLISCFTLAFVIQWKLTLICICVVPASVIAVGICSTIEATLETKMLGVQAQAGSFSESVIASMKLVHAFELRSRLVAKFARILEESRVLGHRKNPWFGALFSAEYFLAYAAVALTFWQGVHMLADGEITEPGDMFIVLMSVITGSMSLTSLAPYTIEFSRAASAAGELFKIMDRVSEIDPLSTDGHKLDSVVGTIEFENVSFTYPMRPSVNVLNNFSLVFPAGKRSALVGASGCGKSTIVGLIERWYDVKHGSIKLDGIPISDIRIADLRQKIRLVQQEPVLFSGSIFQNIADGLEGAAWQQIAAEDKVKRVEEAARIAFAHEFILELPNGYDTVIGERGSSLSGGQKQRIAIARSIVSNPKILLLDEATSALDPHAEEEVQRALDNVNKGRTTITIAHKLATIRNADNIVVLDAGMVVERGTHHELIARNGTYARLVEAQNLAVASQDPVNDVVRDDEKTGILLTKRSTKQSLGRETTASADEQVNLHDYEASQQRGLLATVTRLLKDTPELNWTYLMLFLSCVGGAAVFPGQAILMSKEIDVFNLPVSEMRDEGDYLALMFFVLALGSLVVYFVVGWTSNVVAQTMSHKFRIQLFSDVLKQDISFFDRVENSTGALVSKLSSHPQSVLELMGFSIALILIAVIGMFSCSVVALIYAWKLSLVIVFAGLPPMILAGWSRLRTEAKLDRITGLKFAASASVASEAINAIRTVSSLAIEKTIVNRYTDELDRAVSMSILPICWIMVPFAFTQSVEYWFMALGFWYGCRQVSFNELGLVNFFIAFLGVYFSGQQSALLFSFISSMTKATNAANYIFWLSELQPSIKDTPETDGYGPAAGDAICAVDIHFAYPLRQDVQVLRGIDLQISKSKFIALVGASGCGKSTMIAMLERFYDPTKGSITVGSRELLSLSPSLYRQQVSLVQQEPTLFPGTIRENIAIGVPGTEPDAVSDTDIETACCAAHAWDFINSLPDGLNTLCGDDGLQLSGGQRQRVAIARALIRNPAVLLLDEATSALDTQSERIVQDAISKTAATGDRIIIAVAHRLSTIKNADLICVFDRGRIVEAGTHEQLLALGAIYCRMCQSQDLN